MLILQTLNQHFQGLKSERVSLVLEYQMYGTKYQLMFKVQPQFTCSNPDMMITYAQELLMLSKSSLAEVLFNSSLPGRYSHNGPTGTAENHHRSKKEVSKRLQH